MAVAITSAPGTGNQLYKVRVETTYEVKPGHERRIERALLKHVPHDTEFPSRQWLDTIYFRPVPPSDKDAARGEAPKTDFRIRSYPDTPRADGSLIANLEYKDEVEIDGHEVRQKTATPAGAGDHLRLMNGELAADVIVTKGKRGEARAVAKRAIADIDAGIMPVLNGRYHRTTFTNAAEVAARAPGELAPVRVTLDERITHTGIGQLAGAGTVKRGVALLDVKVAANGAPEWLTRFIEREVEAGVLTLAKRGKGGTAVRELAKLLPLFRQV